MAKDLIIGGASNYTWDDLKYWVNSIKLSGFAGDVVLVATNMKKETIDRLTSEGIILELYGQMQEDGSIKAHSNGAPHVERFFYIWNYLKNNVSKYEFVISTDTRDVIFQDNPSAWLDEHFTLGYEELIASSEGMIYKDEPWNNQNLIEAFGPYFHNHYKSMMICNVGVLAGFAEQMRDLFFMIFQMSINRPIPVVDQVVFNILLNQEPYRQTTKIVCNQDAWAAQLGATLEAVKSGAGDIGIMIKSDPSLMGKYLENYKDKQPTITEDGIVVNADGRKFTIVHQYDRTHAWKDQIMKRYE